MTGILRQPQIAENDAGSRQIGCGGQGINLKLMKI
jgi:hypothetical protein